MHRNRSRPSEEGVLLNFVNADIDAVVRAIGQYTGRTFVIDPRVKGTLSLSTERPVTRQQAYDQLLTALRLQGFTIVQTGNVARVVPEADAKLQGGAVIIPKGSAPSGDQLVTQVFRLQYESATAMVPILRPLIAPNNTISAYPQNNTLVITDYADNLRRIQRIIESIDTPATSDVETHSRQERAGARDRHRRQSRARRRCACSRPSQLTRASAFRFWPSHAPIRSSSARRVRSGFSSRRI